LLSAEVPLWLKDFTNKAFTRIQIPLAEAQKLRYREFRFLDLFGVSTILDLPDVDIENIYRRLLADGEDSSDDGDSSQSESDSDEERLLKPVIVNERTFRRERSEYGRLKLATLEPDPKRKPLVALPGAPVLVSLGEKRTLRYLRVGYTVLPTKAGIRYASAWGMLYLFLLKIGSDISALEDILRLPGGPSVLRQILYTLKPSGHSPLEAEFPPYSAAGICISRCWKSLRLNHRLI